MENKVRASGSWMVLDRKRKRTDITKEVLENMYVENKLSTVAIAKELKASRNTVTELLEVYGIKRRPAGDAGGNAVKTHSVNEDYFQTIDTYDKAYFLGFISTDGHLVDRKRSKRLQLVIADSDRCILDYLANSLGDPTLVTGNIISRSTTRAEKPKACLRVCRTKMVNDLVANGAVLGCHSGKERFLDLGSPDLNWAFVRGVFDADGCIQVHWNSRRLVTRIRFTSGYPLVQGLKEFFESEGVRLSKKCIQPKGVCCELSVDSKISMMKICENMYSYGTVCLPRKYKKYALLNDIVRAGEKSSEAAEMPARLP